MIPTLWERNDNISWANDVLHQAEMFRYFSYAMPQGPSNVTNLQTAAAFGI